ncbi:YcdB/YcdC domain-containing protein [Brevibacillus ginsengisoli]|uniref:YcdB/YcdC domain-containing protein n=1 Tax=Brevibacillus ginsengisoli TaxID=363854 RepID=UPI003CEC8A06
MDIDQLMREYARLDKQQVASDVQFTPDLERSIRQSIHGHRRSFFLRYGVSIAGVAVAVVILAASSWNGITFNHQQEEPTPAVTQIDQKKLAQAVLQKMYNIVPELKKYQVGETGAAYIRLQRNANDNVLIQFRPQTGEIEMYSRNQVYSINRQNLSDKKPTVAFAQVKANSFLEQILGDDCKQYKPDTVNDTSDGKLITYQRFLNGLPLLGDTVEVIVDAAGNVINYQGLSRNWELAKAEIADTTTVISQEEAVKKLTQQMKLRYVENLVTKSDPATGNPTETRTLLEYSPNLLGYGEFNRFVPAWNLDAQTGEIQSWMEEPEQSFKINPSTTNVVVKNNQDIANVIKDVYGINVDVKKLKIGSSNAFIQEVLYEPGKGDQIKVLYYKANGKIQSIQTNAQPKEQKVTKEKAMQSAVKFLEKYADLGVREVAASQVRINPGSYEISFYKKQDGIFVTNQQSPHGAYTVSVDPSTGKVNGFRREGYFIESTQKSFPSEQSVVPLDTAMQEYLKHVELKLAYQYELPKGSTQVRCRLVYVPYPVNHSLDSYKEFHLDAVTGRVLQF